MDALAAETGNSNIRFDSTRRNSTQLSKPSASLPPSTSKFLAFSSSRPSTSQSFSFDDTSISLPAPALTVRSTYIVNLNIRYLGNVRSHLRSFLCTYTKHPTPSIALGFLLRWTAPARPLFTDAGCPLKPPEHPPKTRTPPR
ncbi:C2H2 type master regulator of conidiophore development brlA, partial [Fusarium oxysporum f. sp. albedinis]